MKLNYRRTILIGMAFLSICVFWQFYDNEIPKILTYTFGLGETWTGVIMALDNVLALFMLPLFGVLSVVLLWPSYGFYGNLVSYLLTGSHQDLTGEW